jgi:hypothetical protein
MRVSSQVANEVFKDGSDVAGAVEDFSGVEVLFDYFLNKFGEFLDRSVFKVWLLICKDDGVHHVDDGLNVIGDHVPVLLLLLLDQEFAQVVDILIFKTGGLIF